MAKKPKFLRADAFRHSRLGKNRPKLQRWRKPRGKHNKLRLKRAGHPVMPSMGYRAPKKETGKLNGLLPIVVHNIRELEKLNNGIHIAILARIGAKKKLDIIKRAQELKISISNFGGRVA